MATTTIPTEAQTIQDLLKAVKLNSDLQNLLQILTKYDDGLPKCSSAEVVLAVILRKGLPPPRNTIDPENTILLEWYDYYVENKLPLS